MSDSNDKNACQRVIFATERQILSQNEQNSLWILGIENYLNPFLCFLEKMQWEDKYRVAQLLLRLLLRCLAMSHSNHKNG